MEEREDEDPGDQWELALIGRILREVRLGRSERLYLMLAVNTPTEMFGHLLVFACLNRDGITLSEKPHPEGMPGYSDCSVMVGVIQGKHYIRIERVLYCVLRYLGGILQIDFANRDHKNVVLYIVYLMYDDLMLKFGCSEVEYLLRALPDHLAPSTYFGFRSLGHLCRVNYSAFYCLCKWRDEGTEQMLNLGFYQDFGFGGTKTDLVLKLVESVRAADFAYMDRCHGWSG